MKCDILINKLMNTPHLRNLGLKKEIVESIVDDYNEILLDELLEKGHIELKNGMNIEIVRLIDRVHVLRGITYKSNRKYKLKLTMEDILYKKIEEYYDKLQEDIM